MKFTQFTAARADNGAPLPYARATVYFTGTSVAAQLYNSAGSSIDNPTTADATGLLQFAVADGVYDISIVSADGSYLVPPIQKFQIIDIANIKSTITSGRLAYAAWSELSGVAATNGQVAEVPPSDTGTHVDPVTSGNVANSGVFRRESAGWKRLYDYGDPGKLSRLGDQMLGALDMSNYRVTRVASPAADTDAANRGYVALGLRGKASGTAGKNLFNPATATIGQAMGTDGQVVTNAANDYSAPILVTPGVTYYGQGGAGATNMRFVTFFDVNGAVMASSGLSNVSTFTAPAGAVSVVVSVFHTNLNTFQLEVGSAATAFEAYTTTVFLDSNAVRDRSLTNSKLADGAVSPSKTTFLVLGKNLFNQATATIGYYLGQDGSAPVANSTFDYSDFIPVVPGQAYYGAGNSQGMRFVTYYDANQNFVAGGINNSGGVNTFTAPTGVYFVRITIWHSNLSTFQLEAGTAATVYSPFQFTLGGAIPISAPIVDGTVTTTKLADASVTLAKAAFFRVGKNLFNQATATIGGYISPSDGSVTANATWDYSDFIPVTGSTAYWCQGGSHGARFVAYYTSTKALISSAVNTEQTSFTTPSNCAFVRITVWHSDLATFQLEAGTAQTAYAPYQYLLDGGSIPIGFASLPVGSIAGTALAVGSVANDKLADGAVSPLKTSFLTRGKNLFDKTKATLGYFRGHDNSTTANASFGYSDYIPVTPGQQLISNSGMRFTTFYGISKGFIAGGSSTTTSTITVPANVYFVIVTFNAVSVDTFQLEVGTTSTAYQAYGFTFTYDIIGGTSSVVTSGFSGLTWATLGDSITAGGTWQAKAAAALGMTWTNFGIGGTKISGAQGDTNAMCGDTRITAIATTYDVITCMGGTNDWAQNVPMGDINGFVGLATFATNVMTVTSVVGGPAIKVGDTVSAIGVAAGTYVSSFGTGTGGTGTYNLSTTPGTLASRQTRTYDPTTFYGALNTFADKALARWPDKKVGLTTTPYGQIPDYASRGWTSPAINTLGLTTNDYADAIRLVSAKRNLFLADVAQYAGWGTFNIDTYLGNGGADQLHPASGSLAAKGLSAAHRGHLRLLEPTL